MCLSIYRPICRNVYNFKTFCINLVPLTKHICLLRASDTCVIHPMCMPNAPSKQSVIIRTHIIQGNFLRSRTLNVPSRWRCNIIDLMCACAGPESFVRGGPTLKTFFLV